MRSTPSSAVVQSPAGLHSTLRQVTERLARELENPTTTEPDWSEYEWTVARAVAAMHGISPLLWRTLLWRGPRAWTSFLQEQRAHTLSRHARLQALLSSIDQTAREAGLAATALKGAALHELGVYQAGDRPMADVDLLVRPADAEQISTLLTGLKFRQSGASWKERVYTSHGDLSAADLGEHSANSLKIEVHERICEKLPLRITDVSQSIFPKQPRPGLNDYPSNGSLMRHLLLHAAGSMAFQGLRILQLHDIALLARCMTHSDWNEVVASTPTNSPWWAYPPLELTSRYYRGRIPDSVLAALKGRCPYILRASAARKSLADVSYSYLWVKAFPGIEWSQSLLEMLEYGLGRVRPNKRHLAFREQDAATQVWAKQGDWSRMTQARRILRWLSTRQTRPATMHSIAAAFAHTP